MQIGERSKKMAISVPEWIHSLKQKRKWLAMVGDVFGFVPVCKKIDDVYGYIMAKRRWWYESKFDTRVRLLFPLDKADFDRWAFDSAEKLLAAVFSTRSMLAHDLSRSACFIENKHFFNVGSEEELKILLDLHCVHG